jgi:hypothetical protein
VPEPAKFELKIEPAVAAILLTIVPDEAVVGGKMVKVRATLAKMLEDGKLDAGDFLTALAAFAVGVPADSRPAPPPIPNPIPAPPEPAPPVQPDEVTLELKWAFEPGTDDEGQQVLVNVPVELRGSTIVFPSHPDVTNDRTKITIEAGLRKDGKGLHFSDHPHLIGSIEFIAERDGVVLGTIGGNGLANPRRVDNGVGWGGDRYVKTQGTQGVANIRVKGGAIQLFARHTASGVSSPRFSTTPSV